MKKQFIIPILIFAVILTSCGRYKTYPTAEKVTLVTETSVTMVTTVTTISASETAVSEKRNLSECVYYTKSGKRYHNENPCGRGTYYECTLDEAIAKGLTPCDKCVK